VAAKIGKYFVALTEELETNPVTDFRFGLGFDLQRSKTIAPL